MHQGAEHGRGNSQVPEHGAIASDQGVVVLARPPIVYLVSILAGFGLNAVWPARMMPSAIEPIGGWLILLAGHSSCSRFASFGRRGHRFARGSQSRW